MMRTLTNYQDYSYADMEDIALILKGIAAHPSGQLEVTLRDGRAVSLTYTKTTRQDPKRKKKRFCSSRCRHAWWKQHK